MTKLHMKIASVLASGAVVAQLLATPVLAATTITISTNGADTNNKANVEMNNTQTVVQNNSANISNYVDANASTGGNTASRNTGGNVLVDTGDAATSVSVQNTVNKNVADLSCCLQQDTDILISKNGDDSRNKVDFDVNNTTSVFQDNDASIHNDVDADATSGKNRADRNTAGDVAIYTGDAESLVGIVNKANVNVVKVGDGAQNGHAGEVSLMIDTNGSSTKNKIDFDVNNTLTTTQDNVLDLYNLVDADAKTGYNTASRNTAGEVVIDTGDATTKVGIDNKANFNLVEDDCGCLLSVSAEVKKNGDDSNNKVDADVTSTSSMFQDNVCGQGISVFGFEWYPLGGNCSNNVDGDANSGKNHSDRNTGDSEDPAILTGDAESTTVVKTNVNQNWAGKLSDHVEFGWW